MIPTVFHNPAIHTEPTEQDWAGLMAAIDHDPAFNPLVPCYSCDHVGSRWYQTGPTTEAALCDHCATHEGWR